MSDKPADQSADKSTGKPAEQDPWVHEIDKILEGNPTYNNEHAAEISEEKMRYERIGAKSQPKSDKPYRMPPPLNHDGSLKEPFATPPTSPAQDTDGKLE